MSYKPLPSFLYIDKSPIEGLGLYTSKPLRLNTILGISHIKDKRFTEGYIRTPLGGFYNHSNNPNCETVIKDDLIILKTIKDIPVEKELTTFYKLYKMENK